MSLAERLIARITRRQPDFVIGADNPLGPYLRRWWLIPRNPVFGIYLHEFLRSDDDRAHHDHPWLFNFSILLRGRYIEHTIKRGGLLQRVVRSAGAIKFRWGAAPHRLELDQGETCWTLFVRGPVVREWYFYCMERGKVHWRDFTAPNDKGAIGRGCE